MTPSPNPEWAELAQTSRRAMVQLLRSGDLTRGQLGAMLGLSAGSVTRAVTPLLEAGLVTEGQPQSPLRGRPAHQLQAVAQRAMLLGVSITHDSLVVIATDLRAQIQGARVLALQTTQWQGVVEQVREAATQLRAELNDPAMLAVGVALGGNVPDGRVVLSAPFLDWHDVALADQLEAALGLPVRVENDLSALAQAELWFGVGRQVRRFVVVTIGIGVGYALAIDGRVVTDNDFGHGTITPPLTPGWPDLAHPEQLDAGQREDVARKVGRLVGTAAAFTMPECAIVAGESAWVLRNHLDQLQAGVAELRHRLAQPLPVRVHETDFAFWARGAATHALSWATDAAQVPELASTSPLGLGNVTTADRPVGQLRRSGLGRHAGGHR